MSGTGETPFDPPPTVRRPSEGPSDLAADPPLTVRRSADASDTMSSDRPSTVQRSADIPGETVRNSGSAQAIHPGATEPQAVESALMRLPSDLVGRFTVIREIPVSSGEADLLLVEATDGSGRYVVKVYRRGLALDPHVLGRILDGDQSRVVRVCEFGQCDERWWELQGYVEAGSLADLMRREGPALSTPLVDAIVGQLNDALHHLHSELDVVHRDLKPANVLVLSREPLRLVLSDFGLATVTGFSLRAATGSGTPMYFPPEVVAGFVGGRPRDYWALGMMATEMAVGRHPFAGLQPATVTHHLGLRPVDLSAVEDDRVNLLCRGLLVRDPDNRWGYSQVRAWADGETPPVQTDAATHASGVSTGFSSFTFLGRQHGTRQALAAALGANWADGARLLAGSYQRQRVVSWLAQFHYDEGITSLLDGWDQEDPTPDRGLAQLLVALDQELSTLPFRGYDLSGDGLAALASDVVRDRGRGDAAEALGALHADRILVAYSALDGRDELARIDADWRSSFAEFVACVDWAESEGAPHADDSVRRLTLARLLVEAAGTQDGLWASDADDEVRAKARSMPWFVALEGREPSGPGTRLAIQLLAPVAAEQAESARRDEELERIEARQRAQEEAARELRQRTSRTRRCLVPLVVALVLAIVGLTFVNGNLDDIRASVRTSASERWVDMAAAARVLVVPYGLLAFAGVVLIQRSKRKTSRILWHSMHGVCVTGSVLLPVALPFTVRFYFESKRRHSDPAQPDRRLRPLCLTASWSLAVYALFVSLESRYGTFTYLLGRWSVDGQRWYAESWPKALDIGNLAENWGWTIPVAVLLSVAGTVAAIRSYRPREAYERILMQVVLATGVVAQALACGGWLVAAVASWFIVGYVAVVIVVLVGMAFFLTALLSSG